MTESEWLSWHSAERLLASLPFRLIERRWRWLACGICRQFPPFEGDADLRSALDAAEVFAAGQLKASQLNRARQQANRIARPLAQNAIRAANEWQAEPDPMVAPILQQNATDQGLRAAFARLVTLACSLPISSFFQPATGNSLESRLLSTYSQDLLDSRPEIVHDIAGNPFRRSVIDPDWLAWRDGFIYRLASDIHARQLWDEVPILGDALEDAGCADATILEHCHGPGPHVRGCWVIESLLGRLPARRAVHREVLQQFYAERYCTPLESTLAASEAAPHCRVDLLLESLVQEEAMVIESEVVPEELPEAEQARFPLALRAVIDGARARVVNITPHGRALGGVRLTVLGLRYPASGDIEPGLREAAGEAVAQAIQAAVMVPLERSERG